MKISRFAGLLLGLLSATTTAVRADSAFFTPDGSSVILQPLRAIGKLWKLDLASGKLDGISLGEKLKDKEVTGIVQGAEGEIMILAGDAVWLLVKPGEAKKIADAPGASAFFRGPSGEGPLKDWLFITKFTEEGAGSNYHARKPGTKAFESIFCRRIERVGSGCFSAKGRFFFAGQGDLWEGGFDASEGEDSGNLATLIGCRIAPLAALNTDSANGGSLWVDEVQVAGDTLFIGLRGRHMGSIVRLPVPAKSSYAPGADDETPDAAAALAIMRQSLAKTEVIVPETGGITAMAASMVNGKPLLFYRGENDEEGVGLWLWSGEGKAKRAANEPDE